MHGGDVDFRNGARPRRPVTALVIGIAVAVWALLYSAGVFRANANDGLPQVSRLPRADRRRALVVL